MSLYRDFNAVDELERQFMFTDTVPDMPRYITAYIARSEKARTVLMGKLNVRIGPTLDEYMDIFPAANSNSPVVIFLPGGGWRMLSARDYNFVALGPVAAGITTVIVNYSLCPKVGMDEIVRQARAAVAWTFRNIDDFGGNPNEIYVSGHSAGAHLAAMCTNTAWDQDYGLQADIIKGAFPISGVFDLTPLRYTSHQMSLQLDGDTIARNSPLLLPVAKDVPPYLFSAGSKEPSEFMRQIRDFSSKLRIVGVSCDIFEQAGLNHFETVDGLERKDSELVNRMLTWMHGIRTNTSNIGG